MLQKLETHNYSKIPVFSGHHSNIVGFVKVKNLLALKKSQNKVIKTSAIVHPIAKLNESMTLLDAIGQLKVKNINLAMVYDDNNNKATGMITLKKVFEKLVLKEFLDDDNQVQFKWIQSMEYLEAK